MICNAVVNGPWQSVTPTGKSVRCRIVRMVLSTRGIRPSFSASGLLSIEP